MGDRRRRIGVSRDSTGHEACLCSPSRRGRTRATLVRSQRGLCRRSGWFDGMTKGVALEQPTGQGQMCSEAKHCAPYWSPRARLDLMRAQERRLG